MVMYPCYVLSVSLDEKGQTLGESENANWHKSALFFTVLWFYYYFFEGKLKHMANKL